MNDPLPESASSDILFVGIERADVPEAVTDQLQARGDTAEHLSDVYRALARVGRCPPAAVVVGVDWLSTAELEFFEILGRAHPGMAVYVLGTKRARAKIDHAAGAGATILSDLDDLPGLYRLTEPAPPDIHCEPQPDRGRTKGDSKNRDPLALPGNVFDAELDERLRAGITAVPLSSDELEGEDRTDEAESAGDAEPDTGDVRVPWQNYVNGPRRVPPDRAETPETELASAAWVDEDDPPLLSDEELRALLGDDATFERDR